MAIVGRGGLVLLQVVGIDDHCDACRERGAQGICFGPGRAVICFACIKSARIVIEPWEHIPGEPPQHRSSERRRE
jgi:hypothetical protein